MISGHCGGKAEPLKSPPRLSVYLLTGCQMTIFGMQDIVGVSLSHSFTKQTNNQSNILFSKIMQDIVGVALSQSFTKHTFAI